MSYIVILMSFQTISSINYDYTKCCTRHTFAYIILIFNYHEVSQIISTLNAHAA